MNPGFNKPAVFSLGDRISGMLILLKKDNLKN
jgi:hypothetical protein